MRFCLIGQNNVWKGLARGLWVYQNAMHSGKRQGKNIFSDLSGWYDFEWELMWHNPSLVGKGLQEGLGLAACLKAGSAMRWGQSRLSRVSSGLLLWISKDGNDNCLPGTLLYCCSPAQKSHFKYRCVISPAFSVQTWFCLKLLFLRVTHRFLWLNLLIKDSNLLLMQHWDCIHLSTGVRKQWIFFAAGS